MKKLYNSMNIIKYIEYLNIITNCNFYYALPKNITLRLSFYILMKSHMTKYYPKFVVSNLEVLLGKYKIKIGKEIPFMLREAKILKCITEK